MPWEVFLEPAVERWVLAMPDEDYRFLVDAVNLLETRGPTLGRPIVDRVVSSRHHNMKELRPASAGRSEVRVLFAFDPKRRAILLVAGDKAGNWKRWYEVNVPLADQRFDNWLARVADHRDDAE